MRLRVASAQLKKGPGPGEVLLTKDNDPSLHPKPNPVEQENITKSQDDAPKPASSSETAVTDTNVPPAITDTNVPPADSSTSTTSENIPVSSTTATVPDCNPAEPATKPAGN